MTAPAHPQRCLHFNVCYKLSTRCTELMCNTPPHPDYCKDYLSPDCAPHSSAQSRNRVLDEIYKQLKLSKDPIFDGVPWDDIDAIFISLRSQSCDKTPDEFKWMRPLCFGKHEAACDTKCAWVVRERCVKSLRTTHQEAQR